MMISIMLKKKIILRKNFHTHSYITQTRNYKGVKGRISRTGGTLEEFLVRSETGNEGYYLLRNYSTYDVKCYPTNSERNIH